MVDYKLSFRKPDGGTKSINFDSITIFEYLNILGILPINSINYNKTCYIINGFNFDLFNLTYDNNSIFNIPGLISYDEAIQRINSGNYTKKELYSLYVNKEINKLAAISYGKKYSEITNSPSGRESITCISRNTNNIINLLTKTNYKYFSDLNNIVKIYPNLFKIPGNASSGLTDDNKKALNIFIYNLNHSTITKKQHYVNIARNSNRINNRLTHSLSRSTIFCNNK